MVSKKLILISTFIIMLIACKNQSSNAQEIESMILSDKTGLSKEHINKAPLWAKYSFNQKGNTERGFLVFSDGQLYNRSGDNDETNPWNNWGKIDKSFIKNIQELIGQLDEHLSESENKETSVGKGNIAIQYHFEGEDKLAIISKSYTAPDGKYLKSINDLVNQALAYRTKMKKKQKEEE